MIGSGKYVNQICWVANLARVEIIVMLGLLTSFARLLLSSNESKQKCYSIVVFEDKLKF